MSEQDTTTVEETEVDESEWSLSDWAAVIGFAVTAFVVLLALVYWDGVREERADEYRFFSGACWAMGGAPEGDLCVKDNTVVLRLSETK